MVVGRSEEGREHFRRLSALFDELRGLEPDEREGALVLRCGDDTRLAADVRDLLSADTSDRSDRLVEGLLAAEMAAIAGEESGERSAGPWRLLRRLGRAGSSGAFLADRSGDSGVIRAVVRTFPDCAGTEGDVSDGFWRTFRLLRGLDHDGLARLVGAGVDPDGIPYVAAEVVTGPTLITWCERRALGLRGRLEVFLRVCDALTDAHRVPLAHGGLRSGRVVVRNDETPTILDFGITLLTSACEGTSEPPTPRDDVLALGTLLYELLAGRRPFDERARLASGDPASERPPPPSRHVRDPEVRVHVEGALDAIVERSLRADPALRYPCAGAMAEDLRRYREGLPVLVSYPRNTPPRRSGSLPPPEA